MKNFLVYLCLFLTSTLFSQIDYIVRMSNPKSHYLEVEMQLQAIKGNSVEVKMPVWTPGSYLVRDFSKNVDRVIALDEKGGQLSCEKTTKNTWKITTNKNKKITVKYKVFAFEQSVRTSYLDEFHGFINGTGVFMYTEQFKNEKGTVTIIPHSSFKKITTGLDRISETVVADDNAQVFTFQNYDQLADSPIEIGNQTVFSFVASGCLHEVSMYGKADYDVEKLKKDMAKIVDAATSVYGENPNKHYAFIIHNVTDAQGGLEHINSTTLSVNRFTYLPENYNNFLSLVAHEYFHTWNVKRARAFHLGPFDYDKEAYSPLLYAMEGFTSYFENLILYKAGFIDENQWIGKIQASVNYMAGSQGATVQSIAEAGFDAWIKAYQPTVNSPNTTVSYYTGGKMLGAVMDAMIVQKTKGTKTLSDFMKWLYGTYYKQKNRGFTEAEFEKGFSDFVGEDMSLFFAQNVRGTTLPDMKSIFGQIGVEIEEIKNNTPNPGIRIASDGTISYVRANAAAEKAGLSPNDEIISINSYRVSGSEAQKMLEGLGIGEEAILQYARDRVLYSTKIIGEVIPVSYYKFSLPSDIRGNSLLKAFFRVK